MRPCSSALRGRWRNPDALAGGRRGGGVTSWASVKRDYLADGQVEPGNVAAGPVAGQAALCSHPVPVPTIHALPVVGHPSPSSHVTCRHRNAACGTSQIVPGPARLATPAPSPRCSSWRPRRLLSRLTVTWAPAGSPYCGYGSYAGLGWAENRRSSLTSAERAGTRGSGGSSSPLFGARDQASPPSSEAAPSR